MQRTSTFARLITILLAVIVTPIGTVLLSSGGAAWRTAMEEARPSAIGIDVVEMIGPISLQLLAVLLLVGVVLTGAWSSSGLLAVGVLGVVALVLSVFPSVLAEVFGFASTVIPVTWLAAAGSGVPLVLYPAMGAMGLVLSGARHRPAALAASVLGIVAAPVLLVLGGGLLAWGAGYAQIRAAQLFEHAFDPAVSIAVIVGFVVIVAGVGVTRWSPWALVIPAVLLLAASIVLAFPRLHASLVGALPFEVMAPTSTFFLLGGGVAAAAICLAFTPVLLRTRRRAA